jgi:hypothetical protein
MKKKRYLHVDGIKTPIEVVPERTAEESDYVVCVLKSHQAIFDDDEFGICFACEREIRFRPYMPKNPKKICIECLASKLRENV